MFRHLLAALSVAATGAIAHAQFVIMPDTTSDMMVSFDPFDGSVIDTAMFPMVNTTYVAAIEVNGEIWATQQTGIVNRYDISGNSLGDIGPIFTGGALSNIRGLRLINDIVYITNAGTTNGAPGNAVYRFDTSGNLIDFFSTDGTASSPFSVMEFQGDILVAGSSSNDDIHRYTTAGAPLGTFHDSATISFAHQISPASDGNVWCATFTTGTVLKLEAATGNVLLSFPASSARGVFELGNGNVLWTNGTGVHVYDINTQLSTLVHAGGGRHLHLYGGGTTSNAYCFGDGSGTLCPCGNNGAPGRGCANGANASGGLLTSSGSTSIASASLVLSGSGLQPGQPGLYFQGDNATAGGNGFVNGDGLRCAGGNLRRLQVRTANTQGESSTTANIAVAGAVNAGDTKRYQLWYRNPLNSPCGTAFNLTNGIEITWQP